MSTKASTIFFILFALAAAKSLKEDYENMKGFIKPIIADLTDLSISSDEAAKKTVDNFNNVLGTKMVFTDMEHFDKLASLFTVQNFLRTQDYKKIKYDSATVDKESKAILNAMPSLEQLKADHADNEGLKEAALKAMRQAGLDYIGLLHRAIVYELHEQLSNPKNTKFEFTKYQTLTQEFSKGAAEKIKPVQAELNAKKVAMGNDITAILKEYAENYKKFYNQYFFSAKHLANIYIEPTATVRRAIQVLVFEQAINAVEGKEVSQAAISRVEMLSKALSTLTQKEDDNNLVVAFESVMGFASPSEENGDLTANADFKKLIDTSSSSLLLGMLNILPADEVKLKAGDLLSIGIETMTETDDMLTIIDASYQNQAFGPATFDNTQVSNERKLRNFDLIVYLPSESLSDERLAALMSNVGAINSIDKRRVRLLNSLKALIGTPMIDFQSNLELFTSVYDLSVSCAAWAPEDKLGNDAHEVFDECIEALANDKTNKFLAHHYAFVKFLNLFFMSESTEYQTSFRNIEVSDQSTLYFTDLMKHSAWLANRMEYNFRELNEKQASRNPAETLTFYSGKTMMARFFAAVNKSTSVTEEVREATQVNTNKIQVVLVKDKRNPTQNGPESDPLANKGEKGGLPSLNNPSGKIEIDGEPAKVSQSPKKEDLSQLPQTGGNNDLPLITPNGGKKPEEELPRTGGNDELPTILPIGGNKPEDQTPKTFGNDELGGVSPAHHEDVKPRIQIGERKNLVNEIIGHLPKDHLEALKTGSVDDFINNHDVVVTKDGVETTYVFVKVTRRQSPCHPGNGKKC